MAEGAFRAAATTAGLTVEIDSCGTAAYHRGSPPDPRAVATAQKNGVDISELRARQLETADFTRFTHILAMDHDNLRNVRAIEPQNSGAHVSLLLDVVPGREGAAVADPYYDGEENFRFTWEDVSRAADALIAQLRA